MYIAGYYDGWTTGSLYKTPNPAFDHYKVNICFPPLQSFEYEQLIRIFVKWADGNPQKLHFAPGQAIREAWGEAFPCQ